MTSEQITTNNVETLAAAPLSPTVLYAGTWGSGVCRSADHDATPTTATAGLTLPMYIRGALAVNSITSTSFYTGDHNGGGRNAVGLEIWKRWEE